MKKHRHTEVQIVEILMRHKAGETAADLCGEHGISHTTFYNWKTKYGGSGNSTAQRLRQMEYENRRLKQLVADLYLDREALTAVIRNHGWTIPNIEGTPSPKNSAIRELDRSMESVVS